MRDQRITKVSEILIPRIGSVMVLAVTSPVASALNSSMNPQGGREESELGFVQCQRNEAGAIKKGWDGSIIYSTYFSFLLAVALGILRRLRDVANNRVVSLSSHRQLIVQSLCFSLRRSSRLFTV